MRLFLGGVLLGLLGSQVAAAHFDVTEQRLHLGKYQSRAIWRTAAASGGQRRPAVIMIPGSGPQGPEEMMPGKYTLDGKDHSTFASFAGPLHRAGLHTLALGKPGVEFFTVWEGGKRFYDVEMLTQLRWSGYIENVREAIRYLRSRPDVDASRIYLLGHSEGTQIAIDTAKLEPGLKGLILLGFCGEDIATTLDWQLFRRPIDSWIKMDVDTDHDGSVSRVEAAKWPELDYRWKQGQAKATYSEIEADYRSRPDVLAVWDGFNKLPLAKDFRSGPFYDKAASLPQDLFIYTGALDVQTRPEDAEKLRETCLRKGKKNCWVTIVPGLGHGFSGPRPPRRQPLLDLTLGPVAPEFQAALFELGSRLGNKK